MLFIGIDISKLTFDAAYSKDNRYVHKQFDNNPKGFNAFISWIKKNRDELFICLEATGIYSFGLAQYLSTQKFPVMVVNPIITHAFFKAELNRNKTDKADAKLIARYCEHVVLKGDFKKRVYQPKGTDYEAIQRLVTRCDQLEKSNTQEKNRLEASTNQHTSRSIKRLQKAIDKEISLIKKTISIGFAAENIASYISKGTQPFLPFEFANKVKITKATTRGRIVIYRTEIPVTKNHRLAKSLLMSGKIASSKTDCEDTEIMNNLLERNVGIQYDYYDSNGEFFSSFSING